eukprot:Nitzschia sp. Nitz4//scaffold133_size116822//114103//115095//NITZ4_003829-RA/size116822-processed-gene-0.45-mRNA-1//1//CDS//3329535462//6098//frame0
MSISDFFFRLVCPFLGCLLATATFAAPIAELRHALLYEKSLGSLNPRPWALMTGNCLGWSAYAYYTRDPFILAANLPGLVLSLWLNAGAAKLQYRQMTSATSVATHIHRPTTSISTGQEEYEPIRADQNTSSHHSKGSSWVESDRDPSDLDGIPQNGYPSDLLWTPQELLWLRIVLFWSVILVYVGWIHSPSFGDDGSASTTPAGIVGFVVNLNLVFFYGAPLQTMKEILRLGHSDSIHTGSMIMTCANSAFWCLYGLALQDLIVILPNAIGLCLGLAQVVLCLYYPKQRMQQQSELSFSDHSVPETEIQGLGQGDDGNAGSAVLEMVAA